ncbi:MAG TPA: hypothetical protein VKT49_11870 [Bryobacteraceae bacterium]|nr:hypothetical protein [Bryobacteraceae bacterium]
MRAVATIAVLSLLPGLTAFAEKLTFEDRIELTRGLMAEFATVKVLLPRSKKPLEFESSGTYDKKKWDEAAKSNGPAARTGDQVQITKIDLDEDKIVLQINHGMKGKGGHWYDHVQVGMGTTTAPIAQGDSNAPGGTSIAILFHKPLEPIKAAEIKKMLAPVMDFEKRSSTELYADTLPPEIKQAIHDKRVTVGMDRDQVMMALGRPEHKERETKDGVELEDWIFGMPPGRITFVTFQGSKVITVKEDYAGLGTEVGDPKTPR